MVPACLAHHLPVKAAEPQAASSAPPHPKLKVHSAAVQAGVVQLKLKPLHLAVLNSVGHHKADFLVSHNKILSRLQLVPLEVNRWVALDSNLKTSQLVYLEHHNRLLLLEASLDKEVRELEAVVAYSGRHKVNPTQDKHQPLAVVAALEL